MHEIIFNSILLSITQYHPFIVLELNQTPLSSLMANPKIPLKLITKITPHGPFNFIGYDFMGFINGTCHVHQKINNK